MKRRTGFTLIELLVVIAIIAILAAILFPVFSRVRKTAFAANCQSNMKQIGSSVKMYLTDWDDTYPTNRQNTGSKLMYYQVQLSTPPTTTTTDPPRFEFGVNWVEGLYSYIERVAGKDEASSVWRCQSASNIAVPLLGTPGTSASTASVSYVFNGYLAEQPEGVVKTSANTMLVRELDRLVNAELRPYNMQMHVSGSATTRGIRPAIGTSADKPNDPFLNITDQPNQTTKTKPNNNKLHAKGSHILFADGHVRFFSTSLMPIDSDIVTSKSWDATTEQWYNFNSTNTNVVDAQRRSIGITP